MRYDYAEREVDPMPGEDGPQIIHEPIIPVRFTGPATTYLIRGPLDTGASMTLLPRSYMTRLGITSGEQIRLATAGGAIMVRLATLDLELRAGRTAYRWSARIGFIPRGDNLALLGHAGFLDHFSVTFDGLRRRVTLRPNGSATVPAAV